MCQQKLRNAAPVAVLLGLFVIAVALVGCAPGTPTPPSITPTPGLVSPYYIVAMNGSDDNPGTLELPWRSLRHAAEQLQPGDTAYIREGIYQEPIVPARSGTETAPISYRGYPGEHAVLDGDNRVDRNIELIDRHYLVFGELEVRDPDDEWAHVEASSHITFENMHFTNVILRDRNFQGINFRYSSFNRVLNSLLENWGAYLPNGDTSGNHIRIFGNETEGGYNLIEGNTFLLGAQGCVIVNGSFNIIRNNVFNNEWQKGVYIGYFEGAIGDEPPGTVFPAIRNLVEDNQFVRSGRSLYAHGAQGYEDSGVGSIFRHNILRNNDFHGAEIVAFGTYAFRAVNNHWYANDFVNNGGGGSDWLATGIIGSAEPDTQFYDNVFKNNIFFGNAPTRNNTTDLIGIRINPDNANPPTVSPPFYGMVFAGNLFENPRAELCARNLENSNNGWGDCYLYFGGVNQANAAWFEARYPENFWGNHEGDPIFTTYDPLNNVFDLHLLPISPAIDAGVDLTYTVVAGSGTTIPVDDAWYFQDGYQGMIAPDVIVVGSEQVTVVAIDYDTNQITVDRAISWESGTPVNLPFSGSRPDIGVYETE